MTRKTIRSASAILHLFSENLSEQIEIRENEINNQDR